jgi:Zn-dependent protease with chaperone function
MVTAVLLAAFACALLGPASTWLSRVDWVQRAPRAGVLLWQCVGLSAILSGMAAGMAVAVGRYHAGFVGGTEEMVRGIFGGSPLAGLGLYDALGLTLAADLGIVLCACFLAVTARTVRTRSRHRKLLDLVAYASPEYPDTEFLVDQRAVAYCLPGLRPRIVLSDGAVALLSPDELWAVIEHERAHAHEHHGMVMLPITGLSSLFGWVPYARCAPPSVALLLEMAADDFSSKRTGRRPLAAALVRMATSGVTPSCAFAASGSDVVLRVRRLVSGVANSKGSAALAVGLGLGALVIPLAATLAA